MKQATCTIIAGVNGAGKTTFALNYLAQNGYKNFINADLIAAGLSPLNLAQQPVVASRLFLQQIKQAIAHRENFAFETTISGRSYLKLMRQLQADGWFVDLIYLYLPNVGLSIKRVAERVKHGGANVAKEVITRRYPKSISNLINYYTPLCDSIICLDNSGVKERIIFRKHQKNIVIENKPIYQNLLKIAHDRL